MTRRRFIKQHLLLYNIRNSNSPPVTTITESSNGNHGTNTSIVMNDAGTDADNATATSTIQSKRVLRNLDLNVLRCSNEENSVKKTNKANSSNCRNAKNPKEAEEKKKSKQNETTMNIATGKPRILSKLKQSTNSLFSNKAKNNKNNGSTYKHGSDDKENDINNLSKQRTSKFNHKSDHRNVIHKDNNSNKREKQNQEQDPLAKIIEARNKQKVRFDLTQNRIHDITTTTQVLLSSSSQPSCPSSSPSSLAPSSTSSFFSYSENPLPSSIPHVNGFMECFLFGDNSADTDTTVSDSDNNKNDGTTEIPINDEFKSPPLSPSPLASILTKSTTTSVKDNGMKTQPLQDGINNATTAASTTKVSSQIDELIQKGKKAQYSKYQYHRASNYYLQAMSILDQNKDDPNHSKQKSITLYLLNDTHHAMRTLEHSADIVKMGLRHEEKQEYIRALKMYTVAFRMRRDAMGKLHPTLPILLNMLGSIQMKRGELDEAMKIFELAIYGRLKGDDMKVVGKMNMSNATKAVSMREMGKIYEHKGDDDNALEMYHNSLECVMNKNKQHQNQSQNKPQKKEKNPIYSNHNGPITYHPPSLSSNLKEEISQCDVRLMNADNHDSTSSNGDGNVSENEEMEVFLENKSFIGERCASNLCAFYNLFFQDGLAIKSKNVSVHAAMTLHHIANIHGKRRNYTLTLSAYEAALRGMKIALGTKHPNVAAVLGNIGNLYKEMKNFDLAYEIYQDVLEIESKNLGFCHPEVIVTMHNIAMIEKCRGNFKNSKHLYRRVLSIQLDRAERSTKWYNSTALSYSCLGDVEERDGDYKAAIEAYKKALSTRTIYIDKFHPDLGRLLHKIGVLNATSGNFRDAVIYFAKALRLYEFNNIEDSRVMVVKRDQADVLGKIAFNSSTI